MQKKLLIPLIALVFVFGMIGAAWAEVNTTVKDFRVTFNKTSVSTSGALVGVVELLDQDGKVDVLANAEGNTITLNVASVMGDSVSANTFAGADDDVEFENGKAYFTVNYNQPGTDTIRISVVIEGPGENPETLVLGPKDFQVTVTQPPNDAKYLIITRLEAPEGGDNKDKTDYIIYDGEADEWKAYENEQSAELDTSAQIDAGEQFTLIIKAADWAEWDAGDKSYQFTPTNNQTSEVTVTFVGTDGDGNDGNIVKDSATDCVVKTVTGQMTHGVAQIVVPAGTLTEAGEYKIFLSTPSPAVPMTGVAKQLFSNYTLYVDAVQPAKVSAKLTPAYLNDTYSVTGSPQMSLTLELIDEYGNLADTDDVTAATIVNLEATNHVLLGGNDSDEVQIDKDTNKVTYTDFDVDTGDNVPDVSDDDGMGTSILSISSDDYDVDTPEIEITIYEKKLVGQMNDVEYEDQTYTAGQVRERAMFVALDDNGDGTYNFDDNYTDLLNKKVKVELVKDGQVIDSVVATVVEVKEADVGVDLNNDSDEADSFAMVSLRFTKKVDGATIKISYASTDKGYEPSALTDTVNVEPADANSMSLYYEASDDYDACAGTGTPAGEVDSIQIFENDNNWAVTIYGGSQAAKDASGRNYYVKVEDAYGNEVTAGNLIVASDQDPLDPSFNPTNGNFIIGGSVDVTYSKSGTDVLEFSSDIPGVDSINVNVTAVAEEKHTLTTIEVLPGAEYALTNGAIPIVVNALDENGDLMSGNLVYLSSDPSLGELWDHSTGDVITIGDDGSTFYLLPSNTTGDLTITFRSTDASVTGSATVHIVESVGDIPAAVHAVTPAVTSLDMVYEQEASVVFTVTDADGNPLEGKTVTFSSDNETIATVTSSGVTNADGQVTATITAGTTDGSAHITATSEGISGTLTVNVMEEIPVTEIGAEPGASEANVAGDEQVKLLLNITNDDGVAYEDIAQEWLVLAGQINGVYVGVFFIDADGNIVDFNTANADPSAVVFPFDHSSDTYDVATLALGDLGMVSGDYLVYGYVYSTSEVTDFLNAPDLSIENYVTVNVE